MTKAMLQDDFESGTGITQIEDLIQRSETIINQLRASVFAPNDTKQLDIRFTISEASKLVGRSKEAIRKAEREGRLPEPIKNDNNRRIGYTMNDLQQMRELFGTLPWRSDDDDSIVLAVQSFKGGVGKTTGTCHLSNYLAIQGYRVLLIDTDSQGSSTTTFGFNPDLDLDADETLFPFFTFEENDGLEYAVHKTYWPNIDIIPANLYLYQAEYMLAATAHQHGVTAITRLGKGIASIRNNYDVILIDAPPALGMIPMNVLAAADALIIPIPPGMYDFSSTVTFLRMMAENLAVLEEKTRQQIDYKFVKAAITKMDEGKSAHTAITKMIKEVYGPCVLDTVVKDSAEVDNACSRLKTIYELDKPITSRKVHNRAKTYFDAFNKEVEILIRKTWPSHHAALRDLGIM